MRGKTDKGQAEGGETRRGPGRPRKLIGEVRPIRVDLPKELDDKLEDMTYRARRAGQAVTKSDVIRKLLSENIRRAGRA